jgi:hypothetical protein
MQRNCRWYPDGERDFHPTPDLHANQNTDDHADPVADQHTDGDATADQPSGPGRRDATWLEPGQQLRRHR